MKPAFFAKSLVFCAILAGAVAWAHAFAVVAAIAQRGETLRLLMSTSDGYTVDSAKVEYVLFNAKGERFTGAFAQSGYGTYETSAPKNATGAYTLIIRDVTYAKEAVEQQLEVQMPLPKEYGFKLPPYAAGATSPWAIGLALGLPVLASLAFVTAMLVLRRKPVKTLAVQEEPRG